MFPSYCAVLLVTCRPSVELHNGHHYMKARPCWFGAGKQKAVTSIREAGSTKRQILEHGSQVEQLGAPAKKPREARGLYRCIHNLISKNGKCSSSSTEFEFLRHGNKHHGPRTTSAGRGQTHKIVICKKPKTIPLFSPGSWSSLGNDLVCFPQAGHRGPPPVFLSCGKCQFQIFTAVQ